MNVTNQPSKTWTASGYAAVLEHEAIIYELCDFYMEKVTGGIMLDAEVNLKMVDWLPKGLNDIIIKLQKWEDRNLVR